MPTYEMTVFQWSGTGYNAQYNTSHTAVFTDDDDSVDGGSDANEMVSINGGSTNTTGSNPYKIEINFTDADGNDHVEDFNFFYTPDGGWYFAPEEGSAFTEGATLGRYQSHSVGWDYDEVVCFAAGTLITTVAGDVPVEHLKSGDKIRVQDGSYRSLRMNVSRVVCAQDLADNEKLRPIRIVAGALGGGLPQRDLLVSRQHRMLVSSKIAERMFGDAEALVAAVKLTAFPGIFEEIPTESLTYYHLLFDDHEVVFAEGAPSESLFAGDEALRTLAPEALEELQLLFPGIATLQAKAKPARFIPSPKGQKRLIERHSQNGKTPLSGS